MEGCLSAAHVFRALSDAGADINARDDTSTDYFGALPTACAFGNWDAAKMLLDRNVNLTGIVGVKALAYAARNRKLNVVRKLLNAGVRATTLGSDNPLLSIIENRFTHGDTPELVRLLIRNGAVVHDKGVGPIVRDETWVIQAAVRSGNKSIIGLLLENGADPNVAAKGEYSKSSLSYAIKEHWWDIEKLLRYHGAEESLTYISD